MALIRLNNQSISSVTALPSGIDTGKVLQYKYSRAESQFDTSSPTPSEIDSNLRVTITPTSASNKILVRLNLAWSDINSGSRSTIVAFYRQIDGGTTSNMGSLDSNSSSMFYNWIGARYQKPLMYTYIDYSHNTTSEIVYKFFAMTDSGATVRLGASDRYSFGEAIEIAD